MNMKMSVISIGDKVTGTTNNYSGWLSTFII